MLFSSVARITRLFLLLSMLSIPCAFAEPSDKADDTVSATPVAADPKLEARVMTLSHTLRCLVCQNQSIAESNAPLAVDLRNQVREQLVAGKSEHDIIDYLVARYGDFVLYQPPFKTSTWVLWLTPGILLIAGLLGLGIRLRRRTREQVAALSEDERKRARTLLDTPSSEQGSKSS